MKEQTARWGRVFKLDDDVFVGDDSPIVSRTDNPAPYPYVLEMPTRIIALNKKGAKDLIRILVELL